KDQAVQQAFIEQRQRAEELQTVIRQMAELSQGLEEPLSILVHESQQLADTLRESRMVDRLQALRGHAAASAELVQRLTRLARPAGTSHIINRLLDEVLQSASTVAGSSGFTSDFTSILPDYTGNRETTAHFFRQLLAYAGAYLATVGRPHLLAIKTGDLADTPTLFPVAPSTHIHLDITETEIVNLSGRILPSLTDTLDVLSLYRLAGALGATLDVSAPASGPFRMIVRLPTGSSSASRQPQVTDAAAIERTADAPSSVGPPAARDLVAAAPT